MKKLIEYVYYSTHGKDGLPGDCFELAIHDFLGQPLEVSARGVVDVKVKVSTKVKVGNKVEVKTSAGQLPNNLKGNSYVIYCPVVNMNADILHQEAFVLPRLKFLECLKRAKCYRESKATTGGSVTPAIQSFYNRKLGKPHGRKMFALLDELYSVPGMIMLDEFLESLDV